MKKMNNKSGFTLIEIIVVLIIVGILAAIALPNLFSNVTKSKAAEALTLGSSFRTQYEACIQANLGANIGNCLPTFTAGGGGAASATGLQDPDNANVTFTMPTLATAAETYLTVNYALRVTSAADPAQFITFTREAGGTVTCVGAGQWLGSC